MNLLKNSFKSAIEAMEKSPEWTKFIFELHVCDKGRAFRYNANYQNNDVLIPRGVKLVDIKEIKNFYGIVEEQYNQDILTSNKWNKIHFILYKNGDFETEVFWDEEYFVEMHNTSYQEYYRDML